MRKSPVAYPPWKHQDPAQILELRVAEKALQRKIVIDLEPHREPHVEGMG